MSVKIFVIHHKVSDVFQNEVFVPIQTGADFSGIDLGFLKDNFGDNIAVKNPFYGELTAWYWVLKNWLPQHPDVSHVGFCHYRRVLDLARQAKKRVSPFAPISWADFERVFSSESFSERFIAKIMQEYDVLLPCKESLMSFRCNFIGNVYDQFIAEHPRRLFDRCVEYAVREGFASSLQIRQVLAANSFHSCLNFVMRRDLFVSLANWMFRMLDCVVADDDKRTNLPYNEIRAPAFVAERFFDIWLLQQPHYLRIRECSGYLISKDTQPPDIYWYLSGVKQWLLWKLRIKKHKTFPAIIV